MTRFLAFALLFAALHPVRAAEVAFQILDTKKAGVEEAVVWLVPLDRPLTARPPAAPLEIVQRAEQFLPYVTPLLVGTQVNFSNRDVVQHHVYSLSEAKKFELPIYAPDVSGSVVFDTPGVVAVGCNIHDSMLAYLVVLETPLFAMTGADGRATVVDVPPGRYRAEVWHPRFPKGTAREVEIEAAPARLLNFELKLGRDGRVRRAPDGSAGGYR